jgi:hypothetical protein
VKRLAIVVACSCGGEPAHPPDAAPPADAFVACTAVFTGNFAETSTTPGACAFFSDYLAFELPSTTLAAPLAVTVAIPALPGDYASQTGTAWSASATRIVAHATCVLEAGDQVVPHGTFALHLEGTAPPHGTLVLDQPVRAPASADCGAPLVEHVEVRF